MNLSQALRLPRSVRLALVGAGGKTTALFQLAGQLAPAVVTTSTHLGAWQAVQADRHLVLSPGDPVQSLAEQISSGITLVSGPAEGERCTAPSPAQQQALAELCTAQVLPLLVEADGARGWPLKAPAEYEPVIPDFIDQVVVVAGLSGLGQPLQEGIVHRPEVFACLAGIKPGASVTPEALARLLAHPAGGLKNIPPGARRSVLLNQADTPKLLALGGSLAERLLPAFEAVVVGSLESGGLQTFEPAAGIVLAGGEAARFGRLKQLLDFHGRPLVRQAAETALAAGLSPVVVVSGARAELVEAAVQGLSVQVVRNPHWKEGQASSLRAGLAALPAGVGAAIFLLADQPKVTAILLRTLLEQHRRELAPIVAPLVGDRRANPVLFDRETFPDLLRLQGDVGGRAIFSKYQLTYLPWQDEGLLLDIDTPEDYQRMQTDG
jgi:molybdenum cofactor cytidylyltransferase